MKIELKLLFVVTIVILIIFMIPTEHKHNNPFIFNFAGGFLASYIVTTLFVSELHLKSTIFD